MQRRTGPFPKLRKVYNSSPMDQSREDKKSSITEFPARGAPGSSLPANGGPALIGDIAVLPEAKRVGAGLKSAIKHLYPSLSEAEFETAFANLLRYSEIALVAVAKQSPKSTSLTGAKSIPTMKERSNSYLKV